MSSRSTNGRWKRQSPVLRGARKHWYRGVTALGVAVVLGCVANNTSNLNSQLTNTDISIKKLEHTLAKTTARQYTPAPTATINAAAVELLIHRAERERARMQRQDDIAAGSFHGVVSVTNVASIADLLGKGREGQLLMTRKGKPEWVTIASIESTPEQPTSRHAPYDPSGGAPRSYGGGSVTVIETVRNHSHTGDSEGGRLDINGATLNILSQSRGGTGFDSFGTGDLLVGNANGGLSKLTIGSTGYVLTSSGGTTQWLSPGAVAAAGGWIDDGSVVRLNTTSDSVGIGTVTPLVKLQVSGSGSFTGTNARVAIGKTSASTALEVVGSISGSSLTINGSITSTGALTTRGPVTFRSLTGCTALQTNSNGILSCGNPAGTFGSGNVLTIGDSRYLKTSGGTMTGALAVRAMMSGSRLSISGNANITGSMLAVGNITTRGTLSGALLTQNGAGSNYFMGNVGIGTTTPSAALHIAQPNASQAIRFDFYTASVPLGMFRANGTLSAPTQVLNGDTIGGISAFAYGTSAFNSGPGARILFVSTENQTNTTRGAAMTFSTVANAGITIQERMRLTATGSLGIGTVAPKAKLDVVGTISGSTLNISGGANITGALLVRGAITGQNVTVSDGSYYAFGSTNTRVEGSSTYMAFLVSSERMRILSNGNVGIGTSTAGARLAVSGATIISDRGNVIAGRAAKATLDVVGTISGSLITQNGAGTNYLMGNVSIGTTGNAGSAKLNVAGTMSGRSLYVSGTGSSPILFTNILNGRVGIGTSSPAVKLHVIGDGTYAAAFMSGNVGIGTTTPTVSQAGAGLQISGVNAGMRLSSTSDGGWAYTEFADETSTVKFIQGYRDTDASYRLIAGTSLSATTGLIMDSSGNVGISTATPKAKLEVVGTISGSLITQNGAGNNYFMGNVGIGRANIGNVNLAVSGSVAIGTINSFTLPTGLPAGSRTLSILSSSTAYGEGIMLRRGGDNATGINIWDYSYGDYFDSVYNDDNAKLYFRMKVAGTPVNAMTILATGKIGIGTTTAGANLAVSGSVVIGNAIGSRTAKAQLDVVGAISGSMLSISGPANITGALLVKGNTGIGSGYALTAKTTIFTDDSFNQAALAIKSKETTSTQNMFTITTDYSTANNLVYRITASGSTFADGAYNTGGADYAEWFPSDPRVQILAGEAVCLDPTQTNMVKKCDREADPNIIGIRSVKPSVVGNAVAGKVLDGLGLPVPGYTLVGLIGQLESTATTIGSGGVIKPGDSLTSSATPGVLRKALPGESTVGVALTGLASGVGEVRVLIARTNTSNLTDKIDAAVSEHVANLKVDDKIKASLETVLSDSAFDDRIAQTVHEQLTAIQPLTDRVFMLEQTISALSSKLASLSGTTLHGSSDVRPVMGDSLTLTGSLAANTLSSEETLSVGRDARIGGDLYLEGALIMTGNVQFSGSVQTGRLKAASGSQIDGTLSVAGDLLLGRNFTLGSGSVLSASDLVVRNALVVQGPITISGLATFLGDVNVHGELIVSGRQAGTAMIPAGQKFVTVTFGEGGFHATPVVSATPNDFMNSPWRVAHTTSTGFIIELQESSPILLNFSWLALGTRDSVTASGTSVEQAVNAPSPEGIPFPLDEHGVPVSSDAFWNSCIRHQQPVDSDGNPVSCARFGGENHEWEQPDLHVRFDWNDEREPPALLVPEGYVPIVMSSSSSSSSSETDSSSSTSSVDSSSSSSEAASSASSVEVAPESSSSSSSSESEPLFMLTQ